MNRVGQFLERATRSVPGGQVGASMLYGEYVEWVRGQGEFPESQRRFGSGAKTARPWHEEDE